MAAKTTDSARPSPPEESAVGTDTCATGATCRSGQALSLAKRRLLERLKCCDMATVAELAESQGSTRVCVRQHLQALEELGLVRRDRRPPKGRGRPSGVWALTELAEELFPDRHGELTVELLAAVREAFGEEGMDRLVDVRARSQEKLYSSLMPAEGSLKERLRVLADQRTAEGYMAEVVEEEAGRFTLIEHHCPICDAAKACSGLCRAELQVFRSSLGSDVRVERTRHLLGEDDRCAYRVEPASDG